VAVVFGRFRLPLGGWRNGPLPFPDEDCLSSIVPRYVDGAGEG
jgi:hypothetical protein